MGDQMSLFCDTPELGNRQDVFSNLYKGGNTDRLTVLSMGLGQDSSAIAILLATGRLNNYRDRDPAKDVKIVFSDTGAEWPETYEWREEFREWLQGYGLDIITLEKGSEYHKLPPLMDWYMGYGGAPTRCSKACTIRNKVSPIRSWVNKYALAHYGIENRKWNRAKMPPHRMLIGIANEEAQRARISDVKYVENHYPLIELELDRMECQKIIKKAGFKVLPIKSGCVCCPFQPSGWYFSLREKYRGLWDKVVALEANALKKNAKLFLKGSKRITEVVETWRMKNPSPTPDEILTGAYKRGW